MCLLSVIIGSMLMFPKVVLACYETYVQECVDYIPTPVSTILSESPSIPSLPRPETIRIGVTHASADNVGQILRHFGGSVELHILSHNDKRSIERLQEFYAIFINCGSHEDFDYRVLSTFVRQGGVVYASDHAGETIQRAFPEIFELFKDNPIQLVSEATIVHSTLASHMRRNYLDIFFDLDSWFSVYELSDYAIVYIKGDVQGHGLIPLAFSFEYGEGQVFFTSFHNSAQATFDMINFIEYLVFRIKNVEADRQMQEAAESEGFIYRGQVFQGAGAVAQAMTPAPAPQAATQVPNLDWGEDFFIFEGAPMLPEAMSPEPMPPALWEEYFRYTFVGQGFMLMLGAGSEFDYVTLIDPYGNRFIIYRNGEVVTDDMDMVYPMIITLEYSEGYRVRVMYIITGEWQFSVTPQDDDIVIGIAVME